MIAPDQLRLRLDFLERMAKDGDEQVEQHDVGDEHDLYAFSAYVDARSKKKKNTHDGKTRTK